MRRTGAHQWGGTSTYRKGGGFNLYSSKYRNRSINNSTRRNNVNQSMQQLGNQDDKSFLSKKSDYGLNQYDDVINTSSKILDSDVTDYSKPILKPPMPKKY